MIVRPGLSWLRMFFVWHGSVLPKILPQLVFIAVVSVAAVFTQGYVFGTKIPLNATLLTLFGLTLALFLGFRNSASYQRFEEARVLWGKLLIASRALMSQVLCDVAAPASTARVADALVALSYALKHQLRGTDARADLQRLLGHGAAEAIAGKSCQPVALLHQLRLRLTGLVDAGLLGETRLWSLDASLRAIGDAVGGCERIVSTPLPFVYSVLLHRTVYTYCLLLPFALVDAAELFTPLLCVFLTYTLIGFEAIASEIADPFSRAPNALPLDAFVVGIERSVMELCDRPLPPQPLPDRQFNLT